ncbi:hypothetical protein Scep_028362 [Stephania cephalantha]|uniref:E3 ubiquitin-protein ligase RMA n=1 Tax=Stephania cephalantha TaxID=152367 RepID=A0AAP0HNE1_9MAGN
MDQYVEEAFDHHEIDRDIFPSKKYDSASTTGTGSYNNSGSFDCNICLDNAKDPVVTLCGHLYCWPCLYKWLHFQSESVEEHQEQPQPCCPVCKATVSITSVIPLYNGGAFSSDEESNNKKLSMDIKIPNRPPASGIHALLNASSAHQIHDHAYHLESQIRLNRNQQNHPINDDSYASAAVPPSPVSLRGLSVHPLVGMFSEMVYARMFGNSADMGLYGYPNAHNLMGSSRNPRVRRQEMKAEKSLNRISIFLFCCVVLCLLLF